MKSVGDNKKKVAVISWTPCEYLPPLLSLLEDERWGRYQIQILTSQLMEGTIPLFSCTHEISRTPTYARASKVAHFLGYFRFCFNVIFHLLKFRPDYILAIDDNFGFPFLIYRYLTNRPAKLFVHYYEYITQKERMRRSFFHQKIFSFDMRALKYACWISQCNDLRLNAYKQEYGIPDEKCHVIHNYPPRSWSAFFKDHKELSTPVPVVFCGLNMDLNTLYTKEFAEFVNAQQGKLIWDIYLAKPRSEVLNYFQELNSPWIHVYPSRIAYSEMPERLAKYQVGVILYKGVKLNRRYVECNKLYEFWNCGLDVWFPQEIESQWPLVTSICYPKIVMLNFQRLNEVSVDSLCSHANLCLRKPENLDSEHAVEQLFQVLNDDFSQQEH